MRGGDKIIISSDPRSIWSLDERDRPEVVIAQLKNCAREFNDAVTRDNAGDAQDMAIHALALISGLFPDPNDGVQKMLLSLVGVFHDAKWGRHQHLLLKAAHPINGTKRGYGHAVIGGFAISAVKVLTDAKAMSGRRARTVVAQILADAGCSLKVGDHGEAKPITSSAIRNWIEKNDNFTAQNTYATEMVDIHAANLKLSGATTADQIVEYFRIQASEMVKLSRALGS